MPKKSRAKARDRRHQRVRKDLRARRSARA